MDIAFAGIFLEGAPQGQRTHAPGNQIRQHYPKQPAQRGDHQGLSEKLEQDVPAVGTQGLFHANLAGALGYRDKHDVHQPDAADAKREQTDEAKQNLDPGADHLQIEQVVEDVEDKNCPLVLGIKTVMEGHRVAHRRYDLCMIALVLHHNGIQVIGLGQVAHGAEGNVDVPVDVVVAVLNLMAEHSDDLIGNAVKPDALGKGGLPGKEFFSYVGADDGHACVSKIVGLAEKTSFGRLQTPHASIRSVHTADSVGCAPGVVGHESLL